MNIVILGCGRSGTSIFGELFEMLPGFRYYFEPSMDDLAGIDYKAGPVAVKVPKSPYGSPTTPGLPFVLQDLLNAIPEPSKIFWQVRHPLDAICSLRPGIEANWSHNPKPPGWESLLHQPWFERCARHWAYINGPGFQSVRHLASVYRYEDLIAGPRRAALRACGEAGVAGPAVEAAIDRWCSLVTNEKGPQAYEAKHQVRWSRADHAIRSGRWSQNLSPEEVRSVLPLVSAAAGNLGYELPNYDASRLEDAGYRSDSRP